MLFKAQSFKIYIWNIQGAGLSGGKTVRKNIGMFYS